MWSAVNWSTKMAPQRPLVAKFAQLIVSETRWCLYNVASVRHGLVPRLSRRTSANWALYDRVSLNCEAKGL